MATFCIPKHLVEKLKNSALKGEIDIKNLYKMSSAERRAFFISHTDSTLGKLINTEFEKAMVSKQQTAITDWAKSVFTPEAKSKPAYKSIINKIDSLKEIGVLDEKAETAFLEDLVADKLGVNVSEAEVKIISENAIKIDEAQKILGSDLGNPAKASENMEFFKAKKKMDDYLMSLNPASRTKVLTGTIGRGMMLFSVKSPVLNIGSNIELAFTESLSRRIATGTLKGTDNKLAIDYVKMVNKIYQATGYDLSRMRTLSDTGSSGGRVLGETVHAQGPGAVRKVGRVVEDVVFKQLMGAPDVAFSSSHFADSVNLGSLKLAKGDKIKAREIMNDSMRLDPQTAEGEVLRQQAILDAEKATWTNTSWASKVSEGIRGILNEVSGDLRVGDYLLPFVKTPANVISTGMDYAGMGIPKALIKSVQAFRSGNLGTKEHFSNIATDLVRSGLGITAAAILASQLDDDDFVGAYDPSRAQTEALRNSNTTSFRVGGKWVSVDWLGPIAVPFSAIMFSRKYADTGGEKLFQYSKGVVEQAKNLPGVSDIWDVVRTNAYKQNQSLEEMTGEAKTYILGELSSRLMPSFISDIAKATDPYDRVAEKGLEAVKKKIPGLRETLPEKRNIFGEIISTEPAWSTIFFGARVKTDLETDIIKEINKVSLDTGKSISFTDWDKSTSKKLAQFKEKMGDEAYQEAKERYGQLVKSKLTDLLINPKYQKLDDDKKLQGLNSLDTKAIDKIFKENNFKYKTKSKATTPAQKKTENELNKNVSLGEIKYRAKSVKDEKSMIEVAKLYLEAAPSDPLSAIRTLFTKEQLKDVRGSTVIMERLVQGIDPDTRLDHIVPLEIGGSNADSNLKVVSIEQWANNTPVENYLGYLLNKSEITESKARSEIIKYKNGETTFAQIKSRYGD